MIATHSSLDICFHCHRQSHSFHPTPAAVIDRYCILLCVCVGIQQINPKVDISSLYGM
ncbi:hypothetical protein BDZ89DRAFT_1072262 [Hymenopellis radicata]|nr:hypothetical protein BDZ89DRAFT_1072262 [Hymenopellis radicata]